MIRAGYSPSVRLFEAAACGTPIISDIWDGIETLLEPGQDIVLAERPDDVLAVLDTWPETRRKAMGTSAQKRILAEHTAAHRAASMEQDLMEAMHRQRRNSSLALEVGA
jgi:spore maturation protein CgeB